MKYRPEINGLRAIAVMPVILFHAGLSLCRGGFVGVDIFFVISGYLITSLLLAEMESGSFSLASFYERRARRLLPALFTVLLCCLPFAWAWLSPGDLKNFTQSLAAVALFASNLFFWKTSDYFDASAEFKPLLHTWSLAVEEQYYFLFPLLLLLVLRPGKQGRRRLAAIILASILGSLALAQWSALSRPELGFYLLPTRAWELLIGAGTAILAGRASSQPGKRWINELVAWSGLAAIAWAIFFYDGQLPYPSVYTLVPTLGAASIILCAREGTTANRILGSKLLVGIGLVSYSAYLWHQPLFAFARNVSPDFPRWQTYGALVAVTMVLAGLTWKYIETPFRDGKRVRRSSIFALALLGNLAFLAVGLSGHATNGFARWKTTDEQLAVLRTAVYSPRRAECHSTDTHIVDASHACEYFAADEKWAVFGDSHTVELAYALGNRLKNSGAAVRHYSFSGCAPVYGRVMTGSLRHCAEWTARTVEDIASDPRISHVVVSYRIHAALFGTHEKIYPDLPDEIGSEERERRWASFLAVLRRFQYGGKQVVLVIQAPELPRRIDQLVMRAAHPAASVAGVSRSWWDKRNHYVMSRLDQVPPGVKVIDPAALFCDRQTCFGAKDGVAFYFDDNHLSLAGADEVAAAIADAAMPALRQPSAPLAAMAATGTVQRGQHGLK
ncbi:acyltransferase family protein [Noviherbaspirillum galbum]|uniref:Acyltransferase n=1 Tax=Noviherbaspirillum galbum TaxID=2709383 RepID=A0A6B3SZI3_9BURK|nr:acyltransferase family protein [Noviherbaspirillum galbum]NEX64139.1 acyltransferase [Noviherbaspirillum galbum]